MFVWFVVRAGLQTKQTLGVLHRPSILLDLEDVRTSVFPRSLRLCKGELSVQYLAFSCWQSQSLPLAYSVGGAMGLVLFCG